MADAQVEMQAPRPNDVRQTPYMPSVKVASDAQLPQRRKSIYGLPVWHIFRVCCDGDLLLGTPLMKHEQVVFAKSGSPLGPTAQGYLAWRHSVLMITSPVMALSALLTIISVSADYSDQDAWFAAFFGDRWQQLSAAQTELESIYRASFAISILEACGLVLGSVLAIAALVLWPSLRRGAKFLATALMCTTGLPIFTRFCFPVATFVDVAAVAQQLCVNTTLKSVARSPLMSLLTEDQQVVVGDSLCTQALDTLGGGGKLDDDAMVQALRNLPVITLVIEPICINNCTTRSFGTQIGNSFGTLPPICLNNCTGFIGNVLVNGNSDGICSDGGPGAEFSGCFFGTDCADCGPRSLTNFDGNRDGTCTDGGPGAEAGLCAFGNDCADCGPRAPYTLQGGGQGLNFTALCDPNEQRESVQLQCLQLATFLTVVSGAASTASFGLLTTIIASQVTYVIMHILPTCISLAMGVARSALLTKHVLSHSRWPAWFAVLLVGAGMPSLVAMLALVSQTMSGMGFTLALALYACSLTVWTPLGVWPAVCFTLGLPERVIDFFRPGLTTVDLRAPQSARHVSQLMRCASYRANCWLFASLVAGVIYLWYLMTFGDPYIQRMLERQLDAFWGWLKSLQILSSLNTLVTMYGRINLVTIACADGIIVGACRIWHDDRSDDPVTLRKREDEYEEALALFMHDAPTTLRRSPQPSVPMEPTEVPGAPPNMPTKELPSPKASRYNERLDRARQGAMVAQRESGGTVGGTPRGGTQSEWDPKGDQI
jgi:hypothetical protein